jgi:hypothetical protein
MKTNLLFIALAGVLAVASAIALWLGNHMLVERLGMASAISIACSLSAWPHKPLPPVPTAPSVRLKLTDSEQPRKEKKSA